MSSSKVIAFITIIFIFFYGISASQTQGISNSSEFEKLNDSLLLDIIQKQTINYFFEGAEKNSGLACERIHLDNIYPDNDQTIVTSGGTGFGIMALIVGIERGFINRKEGLSHLHKIVNFLSKAERFHGAWPHWIEGKTGKVKPFGNKDDGGDLVETSFLAQGLICLREYLKDGNSEEKNIAKIADELWQGIEFDWYQNSTQNLYWHWSPNYGWEMNFAVHGFNECHILYFLAACSPNHSITKEVYENGWAENGKIVSKIPRTIFGHTLKANHQGNAINGGPLFWAHYSYLGLDPNGLKDDYLNYGEECKNQALINYDWCVDNPLNYKNYGPHNWGLTASYSPKFYAAHAPSAENDLGIISPTAAASSIIYTPKESLEAMHYWYSNRKDQLWGKFGFFDAFSDSENWYIQRYLAIDQGPIPIMIENYRTGLIWRLFMNASEVQEGLKKLGMGSPYIK